MIVLRMIFKKKPRPRTVPKTEIMQKFWVFFLVVSFVAVANFISTTNGIAAGGSTWKSKRNSEVRSIELFFNDYNLHHMIALLYLAHVHVLWLTIF